MRHCATWPSFLSWIFRSVILGALVGLGLHAAVGGPHGNPFQTIAIGVIFSVVMWGGFHLLPTPHERLPSHWPAARVGLFATGWILLLYLLLLGLSIGLVRVFTGVNIVRSRLVLMLTGAAGLAATGVIATKETVEHQVQIQRDLAKAEARASFLGLQAQLQPHTLFNALNTIAALIPDDPRRAEEATERLSSLLRRILGALERPTWTLAEEFQLLDHLLGLERLRFGDRLAFDLELAPDLAQEPVPPLLLLPLVENALKHGFRPRVGPCRLRVVAAQRIIRVEDNGVGRAPGVPEGLGLRTVRERLEAAGGRLAWPAVAEGCTAEVRL